MGGSTVMVPMKPLASSNVGSSQGSHLDELSVHPLGQLLELKGEGMIEVSNRSLSHFKLVVEFMADAQAIMY